MNVSRIVRSLELHVAGWPLRVVERAAAVSKREALPRKAKRMWEEERSPVRWLQREPRGHSAMRIGILTGSAAADAALLVFDADGPCAPDGLDALCAAAAMTEKGIVGRSDEVALATASGIVRIGGEGESDALRSVRVRTPIAEGSYEVFDPSEIGIPLLPENAARLEKFAREHGRLGKRILYLEEGRAAQGETALAEIGRSGRLLRAPSGAAIGAVIAAGFGRGVDLGAPVRFRGLSGGTLEAIALAEATGRKGERMLDWELRARPRCVGSCEFVADPADVVEGFLLG